MCEKVQFSERWCPTLHSNCVEMQEECTVWETLCHTSPGWCHAREGWHLPSLACTAGATGSCPFLLGHAPVFSASQGLASISLLTLRGAYSQKLSQWLLQINWQRRGNVWAPPAMCELLTSSEGAQLATLVACGEASVFSCWADVPSCQLCFK